MIPKYSLEEFILLSVILVILCFVSFLSRPAFGSIYDFTIHGEPGKQLKWGLITVDPCSVGTICSVMPLYTPPNGVTWQMHWGNGNLGEYGSIDFAWTPPAEGTYQVTSVTICSNDGVTSYICNNDATTVTIIVKRNHPPVANAGADKTVKSGAFVALDGSSSSDQDGDSLSYKWTQTAGVISVNLAGVNSPRASFVAPIVSADTLLTFAISVSDGRGGASSDSVNIKIIPNNIPTANAGIDDNAEEGVQYTLDGSASSDPDGDPLLYEWKQTAGPAVNLVDAATSRAHFIAPIVNHETTLTFELVVNDGIVDSPSDHVNIIVKPKLKVEININPPEINPYPGNIRIYPPNFPNPPQSDIQILTKHMIDDSQAEDIQVQVESCTKIGKPPSPGQADADGHEHDLRADPCLKGIGPAANHRPSAILESQNKVGNPIIVRTDNQGIATITYMPPKYIVHNPNSRLNGYAFYISGEDTVQLKLVDFPSVKADKSLIIRVPNLEAMPGSHVCPLGGGGILYGGGRNYYFEKQFFHGCSFYGTHETNLALNRITNEYVNRQQFCKFHFGNNACRVPGGDNSLDANGHWDPDPAKWINIDVRGVRNLEPAKITAMNLPWGGLNDIGPPDGVLWQNPHATHNNGKEVDIGLKNRTRTEITPHQKLLLRYMTALDPDFNGFPRCEGNFNIIAPDPAHGCRTAANHIHAYFSR